MDFKELIIYEDNDILVIDKPSGLATESRKVTEKDAVTLAASFCKCQIYPIHRLDQPVSGLLLFAKSQKAAAVLSSQISSDKIEKIYTARVHGRIIGSNSLTDYLLKDRTNISKIVPKGTPGSKKAALDYSLISYDETSDTSLINIKLYSGRHHQIRVQLAHAGSPIVGDKKYGKADGSAVLCLTSSKLVFIHPVTGKSISLSATPKWLS